MNFRIGNGVDIHQLVENSPFILGGVKIKSDFGIKGHSDGDIVIHSIVDSLLGALALGDIGTFYPSNKKWQNCNSEFFLKDTLKKIQKQKYKISNIDVTIILQSPKINLYISEIKNNLSSLLKINIDQISIKATTSDYLGFIGKKEGIAALSTVLIYKDFK